MKAQANVLNPVAVTTLNHLSKVANWSVKDDTALSNVGTMVRFTKLAAIITSTTTGKKKVTVDLKDGIKAVIGAVSTVEKAAKSAVTPKEEVPQPEQAKPTTKTESKKMTTKTAKKQMTDAEKKAATTGTVQTKDEKKALAAAKRAAETKAAKAEKPEPIALTNPAGKETPVYNTLKDAAEKTEKTDAVIKAMWSKIGEQYGNKIGGLTKALLAEGLWPPAKDAQGNLKADADGYQVPAGYQSVYKAEKEQGIKGPGHYVNTAAAAFGRINMEQGKKDAEEAAKAGKATPAQETINEKTIAKMILQLETAAQKLPADELKNWLETSKTMQPIIDSILAESKALEALGEI